MRNTEWQAGVGVLITHEVNQVNWQPKSLILKAIKKFLIHFLIHDMIKIHISAGVIDMSKVDRLKAMEALEACKAKMQAAVDRKAQWKANRPAVQERLNRMAEAKRIKEEEEARELEAFWKIEEQNTEAIEEVGPSIDPFQALAERVLKEQEELDREEQNSMKPKRAFNSFEDIEADMQKRLVEAEEKDFVEPREPLANRQAGPGRGNVSIFTVYSMTDMEGKEIQEEEKNVQPVILTKKQAKERRKWERKKERKHLTALINSIQDF